jgi:hypothetical protein
MQFPLVKIPVPTKRKTVMKAVEKNSPPINASNLRFLALLKLLRFWFTISLLSLA